MLDLKNGASGEAVANAVGGKLIINGSKKIYNAVIDSRKAKDGDIFVAICGENTDGHNYLLKAAQSGASAVLIERGDINTEPLKEYDCSVILVKNTSLALGDLARVHKSECHALTVGVTGSVGKTTTRQYIAAVLSAHFKTHKTDGNFNNELGLPLTLLELDNRYDASVLEMGMSAKGEISYLTNIAHPDIAVITNIGTAHIEYLGSREGIRDAKMEIVEGLKENGHLILCGDEPLLAGNPNAVYCAIYNKDADFVAENIRATDNGMIFDAKCQGKIMYDLAIPSFGEHTVLDALYAVAVGVIAGLSEDEIQFGLTLFEGVGNRQKIVDFSDAKLILDFYNASPESIRASLSVTKSIAGKSGGRTIAVLGDVYELGSESDRLHSGIGSFAATLPCDLFFAFGENMCIAAKKAISDGMSAENVFMFPDISNAASLADEVKKHILPNDCILFKSSHSVGMDRVTDIILGK